MKTESLLAETPGSELHATWEAFAAAGVRRDDLKKVRRDSRLATQIANLITNSRERRTQYTYPSEYKPLSIVEQVTALQKVPVFAGLNAAWALNEGPAWYDDLRLPDWIENPLVYVWHESMGGYHGALNLILQAIAKQRQFYNKHKDQFLPGRLRQCEHTADWEHDLKRKQPGDFLIVPSQMGDRWGGYAVKEVCGSYDEHEFGHGSVAVGCLLLSHPDRLQHYNDLCIDCAGDEVVFATDDSRSVCYAPSFECKGGEMMFHKNWIDRANDDYGSVSGVLP